MSGAAEIICGNPLQSWMGMPYLQSGASPKVILTHGVFDLLHLGHIRHLQEARALGDRLVVSVTADQHVNKGMGRPRFTAQQRVEALKALACVDDAFVNDDPSAVRVIARLRPAAYVKGGDYDGSDDSGLAYEVAAAREVGAIVHFTTSERWSSSRLINSDTFSDEIVAYLDNARTKGFLPRIIRAFEGADKFKIAFVGEQITDEYRYVRGLGKSSKEMILATVDEGREVFDGGVLAAMKHGEWRDTSLVTAPLTISKTRFVDCDFNRKLFEVYSSANLILSEGQRERFHIDLISALREVDVAIVLDFGHGLMETAERHIAESSKFLAVNAQTNAGNYGFNPVTKYARADYVCVDDPEARLATSMRTETRDEVIRSLAQLMDCPRFLVTHGKHGSRFCDKSTHCHAPAFSAGGIDTMGAGDAVMAVTAPLIAAGLDLDAAALVGNVVGAIKVGIVGHRRHVGREEIVRTVEALLK